MQQAIRLFEFSLPSNVVSCILDFIVLVMQLKDARISFHTLVLLMFILLHDRAGMYFFHFAADAHKHQDMKIPVDLQTAI